MQFVPRYGEKAYSHASNLRSAPEILGIEHLHERNMVVMEDVSDRYTPVSELKCQNMIDQLWGIKDVVKEKLKMRHSARYVHGDIRDVNTRKHGYTEGDEAFILDWDWASNSLEMDIDAQHFVLWLVT